MDMQDELSIQDEYWLFFMIACVIVFVVVQRFSYKQYPDEEEWQHRNKFQSAIAGTFIFTTLFWYIASMLIGWYNIL